MATTASGICLVVSQSDDVYASYEKAVCLALVSGDNTGMAIFDFNGDNVFEDTVT